MAVHLTRIYTRTGDDGTTGLSDFSRVSKNDARLEAYADCDETNAAIGVAVALGEPDERILDGAAPDPERPVRRRRRPVDPGGREPRVPAAAHHQDYIDRLEAWCDEFNEPLPALNSFILPGGTALSALLHVARTVARRAERSAWRAVEQHGESVSVLPAKYLNRLSDLLFILSRVANPDGDVLWQPAVACAKTCSSCEASSRTPAPGAAATAATRART